MVVFAWWPPSLMSDDIVNPSPPWCQMLPYVISPSGSLSYIPTWPVHFIKSLLTRTAWNIVVWSCTSGHMWAYVWSAMGMPGSETALEELTSCVRYWATEGVVTKLADDLSCGSNTPQELLLNNWTRVLQALEHCAIQNYYMSWDGHYSGMEMECRHTICHASQGLSLASCQQPKTDHQLRSFVGTYIVLARVLSNCASILTLLDAQNASKQCQDQVAWDDCSCEVFKQAQVSLSGCQTITLPQSRDQLWLVTDGAVTHEVGAMLYVTRDGKPELAGFFSAKLRGCRVNWLPCKIEVLSIDIATKHFSPYIIQSHHKACILTDSKPCVQAFDKLCRGEFSASPQVSTFLSTVATRHQLGI